MSTGTVLNVSMVSTYLGVLVYLVAKLPLNSCTDFSGDSKTSLRYASVVYKSFSREEKSSTHVYLALKDGEIMLLIWNSGDYASRCSCAPWLPVDDIDLNPPM